MAPAHVLQILITALAAITGQIGMIEHGVVKTIVRQRIAIVVVLRPQRPVITQALRRQNQNTVVTFLVILNNSECLVSLTQTDAIGDDATLVLLELTDGAHHGVLLEVVELVPDD